MINTGKFFSTMQISCCTAALRGCFCPISEFQISSEWPVSVKIRGCVYVRTDSILRYFTRVVAVLIRNDI